MHEITVEPALGEQLGQLAGQAILCDASGRALGLFSPLHDRPPVEDLQLEPPLSIAETEELRQGSDRQATQRNPGSAGHSMSYRVFWSPHAEHRLEEILRDAAVQAECAAAAREIDQQLVSDPKRFGESRFDLVRIGFVRPLGVQYEVLHDVRTVIVYDVWRIDAKRS